MMNILFGILCSFIVAEIKATIVTNDSTTVEERIFGGVPARPGEFKTVVGLLMKSPSGAYTSCTGTAINSRTVFTAAHCIDKAVNVTVYVNCVDMAECVIVRVGKPFIHPNYANVSGILVYDFGMVKTEHSLDAPQYAQVGRPGPFYQTCIAAGYGYITEKPTSLKQKLHKLVVYEVKPCSQTYPNDRRYSNMVCSFSRMGKQIYLGDSGGPLFCQNKLVGISSLVLDEYDPKTGQYEDLMIWYTPTINIRWKPTIQGASEPIEIGTAHTTDCGIVLNMNLFLICVSVVVKYIL